MTDPAMEMHYPWHLQMYLKTRLGNRHSILSHYLEWERVQERESERKKDFRKIIAMASLAMCGSVHLVFYIFPLSLHKRATKFTHSAVAIQRWRLFNTKREWASACVCMHPYMAMFLGFGGRCAARGGHRSRAVGCVLLWGTGLVYAILWWWVGWTCPWCGRVLLRGRKKKSRVKNAYLLLVRTEFCTKKRINYHLVRNVHHKIITFVSIAVLFKELLHQISWTHYRIMLISRFNTIWTHISAHVVLLLHFALLGVQAVIGGTTVLLTGGTQTVGWRDGVVLKTK